MPVAMATSQSCGLLTSAWRRTERELLLAFGEMMEQIVGGGEAEHRVAKPLEANVARVGVSPTHLVALQLAGWYEIRRVSECLAK